VIHGDKDVTNQKYGARYAFDKAPPHPKNTYAVVGGGHFDTPSRGREEIVA
jgi:hypothetical protein